MENISRAVHLMMSFEKEKRPKRDHFKLLHTTSLGMPLKSLPVLDTFSLAEKRRKKCHHWSVCVEETLHTSQPLNKTVATHSYNNHAYLFTSSSVCSSCRLTCKMTLFSLLQNTVAFFPSDDDDDDDEMQEAVVGCRKSYCNVLPKNFQSK